jgi:hypothetical protein
MRQRFLSGFLLVWLLSVVEAQNFFPILGGQRVGTSVFTFLKIGVSARAVGMGEAVVALQQDAASLYYNPGSVAQFDRTELSASRIQWPADINYDFIALARHLFGRHYIGFSAGILHMAPMPETTEYLPHGTGNYFTYQDRFIALTYGARMTDRFSFGITLKQVQEDLAGQVMTAPMLDMGTFYWTGYRSLRFSASLSHFGSQARPKGTYRKRILDRDSGQETVAESEFEVFSPPTIFRIGAAMDILSRPGQTLTMALQLNHPVDDAENIAYGFEYVLFQTLALRGGYKINKEEENFSFGIGLRVPAGPVIVKVDYAYANFVHLSDPQRLSIGLTF